MYTTHIKRAVVCFIICFTVFSLCFVLHFSALAANDSQDPIDPTESVASSDITTPPSTDISVDDPIDSSVSSDTGNESTDFWIDPSSSTPESTDSSLESTPVSDSSFPYGSDVNSYVSWVPSDVSTIPSDIVVSDPLNSDITSNVDSNVSSEESAPISSTVSSQASQSYQQIVINSENHTPYQPIERSEVESTVASQTTSSATSAPVASVPAKAPQKTKGIARILKPVMWISGVLALIFIALLVYFNVLVYRSKKQHPELYPQKVKKDNAKKSKH